MGVALREGGQRTHPSHDPAGWLMVAWAVLCGALYALMVVQTKAPGLLATARRVLKSS